MGLGLFPDVLGHEARAMEKQQQESTAQGLRVLVLGNSFLYYNDAPRLMRKLLIKASKQRVDVESCLNPGKSLVELWALGNGMHRVFRTENARRPDGLFDVGAASIATALCRCRWDFIVLQDHSRSPATAESREMTTRFLVDELAPMMRGATPVIVETWATYRIAYDSDLATFDAKLAEGVHAYERALRGAGLRPKIARVGSAFAHIRNTKPHVWQRLFHYDGLHPSPLGTYLFAALLVAAVVGRPPPPPPLSLAAVKALWADARFMLSDSYIPWPSAGELSFVHGVVLSFASKS